MSNRFDPFRATVEMLVLEKSDGVCWYCGIDLSDSRWIIEHIHPVSKGGSYQIDNLVPSCRSCNSIKSNHDLETFKTLIQKKLHRVPEFNARQREYLKNTYGFDPYVFDDVRPFWFETVTGEK